MTRGRQKELLVVEDDPAVARVVQQRLQQAGFTVHAESSGTSALVYAAEHQPDLVILDVRLPDLSGYEVCKRLRALCHPWSVPVLMLTGMDRPSDQLRGFAFGADAYLTKPYEATELLKTVRLLVGDVPPASELLEGGHG